MGDASDDRDYLTFVPKKNAPNFSARLFFPLHLVLFLIRFVGTWTFTLISICVVWLFVPTVIFNPLLRALGVPIFWLPIDIATRWWARGVLLSAGIDGITEVEGEPKEPSVIVSNHLSALDSFVVYAYSPISMRFIMKRSMLWICPPIFVMVWLIGCITIDRQNRDKSIQALQTGSSKIKKSGRAFIVFAEGTRSRTGELQEFKKGAFYMAKDAQVPIMPYVLAGPYDLWPPGSLFPSPGTVKLTVLPAVETDNRDINEIALETRRKIAQKIDKDPFRVSDRGHVAATIPSFIWLCCLTAFYFYYF